MKKAPGIFILLSLIFNISFGQLKIPYQQNEIPVNSIKSIHGYVGDRIKANQDGSIKAFDIDRYVSMVESQDHTDWWWIGEQPGKWLESAVLCSSLSRDSSLLNKAQNILVRLENAQQPDGYLGITHPSLRTAKKPLRGMDPYELYFMLHGLITASEQWEDESALKSAIGLADYFVSTINEGKAEFWPTDLRSPENFHVVPEGISEIAGHSVHCGLEGTLLIDPVLRLYQITGDKNYLEWSEWIVKNMDKWSGWNTYSRLDSVADGTMGIDEVQPYVHSHTFQMNFLGLLRLYQITGDESIFRKVKGVWDDVNRRQSYITGGVSVGEHYEKNHIRPLTGNVVETCATMSWMQLTQQLLLITGNPKYADNIERLLFNHVFASQAFDGDSYRYHTPPNGYKPFEYFHGPDCCTSSGHRIVSMLPTFIYATAKNAICINQYVASETEIKISEKKSVNLTIQTDYPQSERITILPKCNKNTSFTLKLRIPEWCSNPTILINGEAMNDLQPGSYANITRKWRAEDKVELIFPMELQWIEHDHFANIVTGRLPGGEIIFDIDSSRASSAPFALMRGPIAYAVDNLWWEVNDMPNNVGNEIAYIRSDVSNLDEVALPDQLLGPGYKVDVKTVSGKNLKTLAVPFTNVGLWYRFNKDKPEPNSKAYSYAIWLQDHESIGFKSLVEKHEKIKAKYSSAIDYVLIGNRTSEKEHHLNGLKVGKGTFNELNWVDSRNWMSFNMKVSTSGPTKLICSYWGSDNNRTFDIYANDIKIGEQSLSKNQPGEFFDVSYDVPYELVRDKTNSYGQKINSVTIKFVAKSGSTAGGIFGIQTMEVAEVE